MARTHVAQPKKSKKKLATGIIAGVLSAALLVGGAFAWSDFSQNMTNRFRGGVTADVLLHDDFQPWENKDVYVENMGEQPLIVRVLFKEFFQVGNDMWVGGNPNDTKTWPIHKFETADEINECDLITHKYFEWNMTGAQKTYLHGTSEQGNADWSREAVEDPTNLGPNSQMFGNTAAASTIMTIADWVALTPVQRAEHEACWILDTDGWAYWSQALAPAAYDENGNVIHTGEATNLLLDNVTKIDTPEDNYYYAIDVQLQAANKTEYKDLLTGKNGLPGATKDAQDYIITPIADPANAAYKNIDELFPDPVFRAWVKDNVDTDSDGYLTQDEIDVITEIEVGGWNMEDDYGDTIKSLQGIHVFSKLTELFCEENDITALDLSGNPLLINVNCQGNSISTLNVSKNTKLTELQCNDNNLTSLDVSKNVALTYLDCENNSLTSLDVSKNVALEYLYCSNNSLTSLDVSKNVALIRLDCFNNSLTSLDVSKNAALKYLYCANNNLTSLDVSKNATLATLYCANNNLTSLDVSKNVALTYLNCSNNNLTSLDVSKNVALTYLNCSNNNLTSLDVSKNATLAILYCFDNNLTSLDMSDNAALTYLNCSNNSLGKLDISGTGIIKWQNIICKYNGMDELFVNNTQSSANIGVQLNQKEGNSANGIENYIIVTVKQP